MGHAFVSVAGWLWRFPFNWDAVSAVATLIATAVALFLPWWLARREWNRQDSLRQEDSASERQKLIDVRHEVCSAVDQVLAYREAAIALFDSAPAYTVGKDAIALVRLNTQFLAEMLDILKGRSELSDGAVFSAVAGRKIAHVVVRETAYVGDNWGLNDPDWTERRAALEELNHLAALAQERSDRVRIHHKLPKSGSAEEIRQKYLTILAAIKESDRGQ